MGVRESKLGGGRTGRCKNSRHAIEIERPSFFCASGPRLRAFAKKLEGPALLARHGYPLREGEVGGVDRDHGSVWEVHHFA